MTRHLSSFVPVPHKQISRQSRLFLSPRHVHDILSASSFLFLSFLHYDKYPDYNIKRPDVEVFADTIAILWHILNRFDSNIFPLITTLGFLSYALSMFSLMQGEHENANMYHIGLHTAGQISLLLLAFDILSPR